MRKERFPLLWYASPGALPALKLLYDFGMEWISVTWPTIPWGWLAAGCIVFYVGMLYADLGNCSSRLQNWLRYRYRLFDAGAPIPASEHDSPHHFHIKVRITFVRSMEVHAARYRIRDASGAVLHTLPFMLPDRVEAEDEHVLTIATIPESAPTKQTGSALWGAPDAQNRPTLLEGFRGVCEVYVRARLFRTTHKIYIEMFQAGSGTSGRFYVTDEDRHPFVE